MKLHELASPPGSRRTPKRLGRGHGSGRVKTSGKGTKGQNARSGGGVKPFFEGGQNPWTMRVPHKRGFNIGRFRKHTQVLNLRDLEQRFESGETASLEALKERGLIKDASGKIEVKLLGDGQLSKPLTVQVHRASQSARSAVEAAGGTLTLLAEAAGGEVAEAGAEAESGTTAQ